MIFFSINPVHKNVGSTINVRLNLCMNVYRIYTDFVLVFESRTVYGSVSDVKAYILKVKM